VVTFADITLDPGGLIAWLIVGVIAGWLAGMVMKGGGYGVLGDVIIGLVGAVLGGFLFGQFADPSYGLVGSIAVAFLGACLLIAVVRFLAPGRSRL
jgi:uncharacterized membrane protein YeaQ/YmgE (transglycosylase-associated protein family)